MEAPVSDQDYTDISVSEKNPRLSRQIKSMIDIRKARTPSALWRYAGLTPSTHSNYNRRLKSLLLGPAVKVLLATPSYHGIYSSYRSRLATTRPSTDKTHLHRMATRYMVKQYLKHLHLEWRRQANLSIPKPYDPDR